MTNHKAISSSLILLIGLSAMGRAAASVDRKIVNPLLCRAVAPGTLESELTINAQGVFNPGSTNDSSMTGHPCLVAPSAGAQTTRPAGLGV